MDPRIRYAPALLVVVLVMVRIFVPSFLATPAWWVFTWYWIILIPLLYLAAYFLTPPFVQAMNRLARRAFILPIVFVALAVGALWALDVVLAHFHGWWGTPELHMLDAVTGVFTGGNA